MSQSQQKEIWQKLPKTSLRQYGQQLASGPSIGSGIKPTMARKHLEYYQCNTCDQTLTDETALFNVEGDDAAYCDECYYAFPHGPFFGEYDTDYDEHHPTAKQQICVSCKECCKGCWYLDSSKGCIIYPYRPVHCRGYECDKLKGQVG